MDAFSPRKKEWKPVSVKSWAEANVAVMRNLLFILKGFQVLKNVKENLIKRNMDSRERERVEKYPDWERLPLERSEEVWLGFMAPFFVRCVVFFSFWRREIRVLFCPNSAPRRDKKKKWWGLRSPHGWGCNLLSNSCAGPLEVLLGRSPIGWVWSGQVNHWFLLGVVKARGLQSDASPDFFLPSLGLGF